ncbi:hypothetical protein LC048_02750 [Mesobacillus subterraneus]|uniref:hypothetical protein n=1 Tax=Mesobacillus subterraneus TaxID=285983 RepID=UPI001CFDFFA3|nr:hypothetical protein [Mesobacillus subterraneus]WLR55936.1 hypothetical protein LC048_02750 [Mesobacillus subterraneus]
MTFEERVKNILENRRYGHLTDSQTVDQVFQEWLKEHKAMGKKFINMDENGLEEAIRGHVVKLGEYEDAAEWEETFVQNVEDAHSDYVVTK